MEGDYFGLEFPDHKKITVGDTASYTALLPSVHVDNRVIGAFPLEMTSLIVFLGGMIGAHGLSVQPH